MPFDTNRIHIEDWGSNPTQQSSYCLANLAFIIMVWLYMEEPLRLDASREQPVVASLNPRGRLLVHGVTRYAPSYELHERPS